MISNEPDQDENADNPAASTRLRSLQNPLDSALYHPLAARLARLLARTPITPNMVSIAGGTAIVLAGIAYTQLTWPVAVLVGMCIHMLWHVLDGADGDLARLTGRVSPTGEIVDGICDYLGHFLLYALLAHAAFDSMGWMAWVLGFAAGFSRIAQASFYEAQRRQFLRWVQGVAWLRTSLDSEPKTQLGKLGGAYLGITDRLAPGDARIDEAIRDPERKEAVHTALIKLGPDALSGSALLGANYRTLALGASMLAGSPLWYFLYEATLLNVLLAHGIWRARRNLAAIRAEH